MPGDRPAAIDSDAASIEPVSFLSDGLRLTGGLARPLHASGEGMGLPGLCLLHGFPSGRAPDSGAPPDPGYAGLARWFAASGLVTLVFNLRGAGDSEGDFDIEGWVRDGEAALDFLASQPGIDPARLALWGSSMGAATAIALAVRRSEVAAVVACSTPACLELRSNPEDAVRNYRAVGIIRDADFPPSLEEWQEGFRRVRPLQWVGHIAPRPLLLVHGTEDPMVPFSDAQALYDAAGEPKSLLPIVGAGHRLRNVPEAVEGARDWILKSLGVSAP